MSDPQDSKSQIEQLEEIMETVASLKDSAFKLFKTIEPTLENFDFMIDAFGFVSDGSIDLITHQDNAGDQVLEVHSNTFEWIDEKMLHNILKVKYRGLESVDGDQSTNGRVYCYYFTEELFAKSLTT